MSNSRLKHATGWQAVVVAAVALTMISFLFIHAASGTFWLTVWDGKIWLNQECDAFAYGFDQHHIWQCGAIIPYRWVLAVALVAIAGALISGMARKTSN